MSAKIIDNKKSFILENDFVKIEVSKKDAEVISVLDKKSGNSIISEEKCYFFKGFTAEGDEIYSSGVEIDENIAIVKFEKGEVKVKLEAFDTHFITEVLSKKLPGNLHRFVFTAVNFEYDYYADEPIRAAGLPMTITANTYYYPYGRDKKVVAEVWSNLGVTEGTRYGFCIVPRTIHRQTLKEIAEKIDIERGIVSRHAGPWARDSRVAFGSYYIDGNAEREHIKKMIPCWKEMGVDQIDLHKGPNTVRQGDFKFMLYEDEKDWCENLARPLKENGLDIGLHTYAFYIDGSCHEILEKRENREMLDISAEFTLAEDLSADARELELVEDTKDLSDYYGFFSTDMPYIIIDDEIIHFTKRYDGKFINLNRGYCGTAAASHKKGAKVRRIKGLFNLMSPRPDSKLYIDIAHYTADAYNKGEFAMIYLDALDGITRHSKKEECWYYCALFVHEIVKNCKVPPIIEYSTMDPSIWAARARTGAIDTPFRAYRELLRDHHAKGNQTVTDLYACTLGWYDYFPMTDRYPGNQHTKYHHWDAIDFMGNLAVFYDYSTVFRSGDPETLARYAGLRRNLALYRKYDKLRQSGYFSEEYLEKVRYKARDLDEMRKEKVEYKLVEKKNGKFIFVEKKYETKRLYSILEEGRNTAEFENIFKKQTPFVRIEHCMSTLGEEGLLILPMNENAPVSVQTKVHKLGGELNMAEKLAMKVRVLGNGKKGYIGIKMRCATNSEHGYGLYIIETDFEGWRDFVLLEADNGDRPDTGLEKNEGFYPIYRSGLNMDRITQVEVEVSGDVEGVLMSGVTACRQTYNVWKNPAVKIGDEHVMFECELLSTDFIEWDGKEAKVIDRYGNEKPVWFTGNITAPKGKFKASLHGASLNNCPVNAYLTFGFTGKEIK